MEQLDLPFPAPVDAKPWPNGLGFDWREWEFWNGLGGRREANSEEFDVFGSGNWVRVLCGPWSTTK